MSETAVTLAKRIQLWPIDRLVPYERNARTHSDEQVLKIAASMAEFGFTNPILVDADSGIIAGHGRLAAARRLGLEQVPVIQLDHLTDAQRRAYILADNRLAEDAGWDNELLAAELRALEADGLDLELTGFNEEEINRLLNEADLEEEDDEPPEHGGDGGPVIQYNIIFDDEDQQRKWYDFVKWLKRTRPEQQTLGARLADFIEAMHLDMEA